VVSTVGLLDELFQLHKPVIPDEIGVPPALVLVVAVVLLVAWVVVNWSGIVGHDEVILLTVMGWFAIWLLFKLGPRLPVSTPAEVCAKLLAIATWTLWVARAARAARR
jgi:hypothetical protein